MKEKRLEEIVNVVDQNGIVSYADLCARLHVSAATIRRDLAELDARGQIERVRRGAKSVHILGANEELPYMVRAAINVEEKHRIAQYALTLIHPNESIILDSSSTVRELAKLLANISYPITVITNDIEIARLLTANHLIELIMVGGRVRIGHCGTVGVFADTFWQQVRTDKLFLGVDAIHPINGFFNHNSEELTGKRLMLHCAQYRIVLADHYKFFTGSLIKLCEISDVDLIITSKGLGDDIIKQFPDENEIVCV